MIFKCPGSQKFSQPQPETIKCPYCGAEAEIWTDEVKIKCPKCKKNIMHGRGASCLDWCKYAKECVGGEIYKKYLKSKKEDKKGVAMLSRKILEVLSEQMNKEIYSGYFYLGMANYAASTGLKGFANWFYKQWEEEIAHAKKFLDYINENDQRAILKAIDEPPQDFTSGKDLFERTLAHERKVTRLINNLVEIAKEENDQKTVDFLQWFVKEQVEEEQSPANILKAIEKAGEKSLSEVDCRLAARK